MKTSLREANQPAQNIVSACLVLDGNSPEYVFGLFDFGWKKPEYCFGLFSFGWRNVGQIQPIVVEVPHSLPACGLPYP